MLDAPDAPEAALDDKAEATDEALAAILVAATEPLLAATLALELAADAPAAPEDPAGAPDAPDAPVSPGQLAADGNFT